MTRENRPREARTQEPNSNMSREDYHRIVRVAKDYIAAGDIFQVVLSQRFSVPFDLPPFSLYRALRRLNPSPFLSISTSATSPWSARAPRSWSGSATRP